MNNQPLLVTQYTSMMMVLIPQSECDRGNAALDRVASLEVENSILKIQIEFYKDLNTPTSFRFATAEAEPVAAAAAEAERERIAAAEAAAAAERAAAVEAERIVKAAEERNAEERLAMERSDAAEAKRLAEEEERLAMERLDAVEALRLAEEELSDAFEDAAEEERSDASEDATEEEERSDAAEEESSDATDEGWKVIGGYGQSGPKQPKQPKEKLVRLFIVAEMKYPMFFSDGGMVEPKICQEGKECNDYYCQDAHPVKSSNAHWSNPANAVPNYCKNPECSNSRCGYAHKYSHKYDVMMPTTEFILMVKESYPQLFRRKY